MLPPRSGERTGQMRGDPHLRPRPGAFSWDLQQVAGALGTPAWGEGLSGWVPGPGATMLREARVARSAALAEAALCTCSRSASWEGRGTTGALSPRSTLSPASIGREAQPCRCLQGFADGRLRREASSPLGRAGKQEPFKSHQSPYPFSACSRSQTKRTDRTEPGDGTGAELAVTPRRSCQVSPLRAATATGLHGSARLGAGRGGAGGPAVGPCGGALHTPVPGAHGPCGSGRLSQAASAPTVSVASRPRVGRSGAILPLVLGVPCCARGRWRRSRVSQIRGGAQWLHCRRLVVAVTGGGAMYPRSRAGSPVVALQAARGHWRRSRVSRIRGRGAVVTLQADVLQCSQLPVWPGAGGPGTSGPRHWPHVNVFLGFVGLTATVAGVGGSPPSWETSASAPW